MYWPIARLAKLTERMGGGELSDWSLSAYRSVSFYTMRTDALDRFGNRLEHRFTRDEITIMMAAAGFETIRFRGRQLFWVACGTKTR